MASKHLFFGLKAQTARVGLKSTTQLLIGRSAALTSSQPLAQTASPTLTFVRYATKRAAGSRTSNKDSRGRRLGSKVSDGMYHHYIFPIIHLLT